MQIVYSGTACGRQGPTQDVPYDLTLCYVLKYIYIVGIGPIFKYQSDQSDHTCVYS